MVLDDAIALPPAVHRLVDLALEEDLGRGDLTSEAIFAAGQQVHGVVVAKGEAITLSGLDVARLALLRVAPAARVRLLWADGDEVAPGTAVLEVDGPVRGVLAAERTALNFLQRLSGIATATRRYVAALQGSGARVTDTRKTAPGFRFLDKRAVRHGGGANHRADLGSGVLIKDNHIAACGGVARAVAAARRAAPHTVRVEVEVTCPDQLREALEAEAEVVLLDNMTPQQVAAALALLPPRGDRRRPLIEVSGNIRLETVRLYAEAGADLISVGALTHSVRAADLSLELG